MAHFVQIDENNRVIQVVVIDNSDCGDFDFPESEEIGIAFCKSLFGEETNWKQTSYNSNFRKNYAGINSFYVPEIDIFSIPQPFPSWTLNFQNGEWVAPVPMPEVPINYVALWDEENQEWDIILDRMSI